MYPTAASRCLQVNSQSIDERSVICLRQAVSTHVCDCPAFVSKSSVLSAKVAPSLESKFAAPAAAVLLLICVVILLHALFCPRPHVPALCHGRRAWPRKQLYGSDHSRQHSVARCLAGQPFGALLVTRPPECLAGVVAVDTAYPGECSTDEIQPGTCGASLLREDAVCRVGANA